MKSGLHSYLREHAKHGTTGFPAGFYDCQVPRDFQDMPFHWHEELEFTMVRSGSLQYSIDLASMNVREGDLLLIPPDTLHSAHQLEDQSAATDSVVFHLNLAGLSAKDACAERYIRPLGEGELPLPTVVRPEDPFYQELQTCFQRMWACRHPDAPYRELMFRGEAVRLVLLLWQMSGRTGEHPPRRMMHPYEEKLKLVLAYMQEHYTESITVKQLADLCGFSQVHFMNVFKEAIGSTCIQYLIEYRLALAAADLQETNRSVMQIAMDNGFQNISYFNRTFKKKYHVTPLAYRKNRP